MVPSPDQLDADAARVFDRVCAGGIAIVHMDVAYAILSRTDDALRRVYAAKNRPMDRASGIVGNHAMHDALHILGDRERRMIRAVTMDHDLPLSVIAPVRTDHPFMRALTPFLAGMATQDGTVNLLLNSGDLRERIAAVSWAAGIPLIASSANASGCGTKYRAENIEPAVRAVADIIVDYGPAKHEPNPIPSVPPSSTQIDFRSMRVVRRGVCFERIAAVLDEFGVNVRPPRA